MPDLQRKVTKNKYQPIVSDWTRFRLAFDWGAEQAATPVLGAMDELPADMPRDPPRDLGEARASMERVLKLHPTLGFMGYGTEGHELLLSDELLVMFARSRDWLRARRPPPGKRGSRRSSYYLKHVAGNEIQYTYSGPFIAAAIEIGMRVSRVGRTQNAAISVHPRFDIIR